MSKLGHSLNSAVYHVTKKYTRNKNLNLFKIKTFIYLVDLQNTQSIEVQKSKLNHKATTNIPFIAVLLIGGVFGVQSFRFI